MKRSVFLVSPRSQFIKERSIQHWEIVGNTAVLLNNKKISVELEYPENNEHIEFKLKERLSEKITNRDKWWLFSSDLSVNQFYPRIYRPVYFPAQGMHARHYSQYSKPPFNQKISNDSVYQLTIMSNMLRSIFLIVSPTKDNLRVYGNEIRNLLILASTEFEAQCKGIMKANGYVSNNWNTNDYVKLVPVLKLNEYAVKVFPYADITEHRPFSNWSIDKPTQSLEWYSAYQATKHDRENKFIEANLNSSLEAVAACAILIFAQYGGFPIKDPFIENLFHFIQRPKWLSLKSYSNETISIDDKWEPVNFNF